MMARAYLIWALAALAASSCAPAAQSSLVPDVPQAAPVTVSVAAPTSGGQLAPSLDEFDAALTASLDAADDREPKADGQLYFAKTVCDSRGTPPRWQKGFEDCAVIEARWRQYRSQRDAWRAREDQRFIRQEIQTVHKAAGG